MTQRQPINQPQTVTPAQAMVEAVRLFEAGQYPAAENIVQQILKLHPEQPQALHMLGAIAYAVGKPDLAIALMERAVAADDTIALFHANLTEMYRLQGRLDEAVRHGEKAVALDPTNVPGISIINPAARPDFALAYNNLGRALKDQNRVGEALACYQRAIELRPDYAEAHWNEAVVRFLLGDFAGGWAEYEWRWQMRDVDQHIYTTPLWDGGDLTGKTIIVHCEQGHGDSLQFIRYLKMVKAKAKGGRVWLSCPTSMVRLFEMVEGVDRILLNGEMMPVHDCQAPLLSLPGLLKTTRETIPADVPYLHPNPALVGLWRQRLAGYGGLRVGVVWRGRPTHKNDRNRSMRPEQFAALLARPEISVISLQQDGKPGELAALGAQGRIFDAGPHLKDFEDTAAIVANLDLVIGVDTSVCHLAGSLAVPVWALLPFSPDWRWLLECGEYSPWYPSMRLFRQPRSADWQSVIAAVNTALSRHLAELEIT